MPNITASKYGIATGSLSQNFSTARTTASSYSNQPSTSNSTALEYFRDSGKGGTNYRFRRFSHHNSSISIMEMTISYSCPDVRILTKLN